MRQAQVFSERTLKRLLDHKLNNKKVDISDYTTSHYAITPQAFRTKDTVHPKMAAVIAHMIVNKTHFLKL